MLSDKSLYGNSVIRRAKQGLRFGRLSANLLAGSAFIQGCFAFPKLSNIHNSHLNDYALFNFWVQDLVRSMNVELSIRGEIMAGAGLFVSNHISWLDTIILNEAKQLGFIARHDLAGWPFLGAFTQRMHSVFIDRSDKFKAYRSIPLIEGRLSEGRSVLVFPEATTSDGKSLRHFYPMFYEAAVRTGKWVQPIAIQYKDGQGNILTDAAFIDDDSFMDTLSRILYADKVFATLTFLPPLDARKLGRKGVCAASKQAIASSLGLLV